MVRVSGNVEDHVHIARGIWTRRGDGLVPETDPLIKSERGLKAGVRDERDPARANSSRKVETGLQQQPADASGLRRFSYGEFEHFEFAMPVWRDAARPDDDIVLHRDEDPPASRDDRSVRIFQVWLIGRFEETVTHEPGSIECLECGGVFGPE